MKLTSFISNLGLDGRFPFSALLWASIMVSALGFLIGPVRWLVLSGPNDVPTYLTVVICNVIALIWLVLFVVIVIYYRYKALWLIFEAPFVLYWPMMFTMTTFRSGM